MDASPTRGRYTFWELHRMLADCYETDVATSSVAPGRISWTERSSSIHRGRKGRSQSVKRDRRPSLEVTVVHPPKPPPTQELPPAPPLDPILCQSVSPDSSSEKPANVAHRSFVQTLRSSAWFADLCFVVFFSNCECFVQCSIGKPRKPVVWIVGCKQALSLEMSCVNSSCVKALNPIPEERGAR